MRNVRVSEIFTSIQGEGTFTGMPSIWVRFFGCNLQCNGFGQKNPLDPSTYDLPYQRIDVSKYASMGDLPVFDKGCDSSYSWAPHFKRLAKNYTVEGIASEVIRLAVDELGLFCNSAGCLSWWHPKTWQKSQLCFTGGEPMLYQGAMLEICRSLVGSSGHIKIPRITIETNGTVPLNEQGLQIKEYTPDLHISCSPKLASVSGEHDAVDIDTIGTYMDFATSGALKFVHNGSQDAWDELDTVVEKLLKKRISEGGVPWNLYIMPVGSVIESQDPEFLSRVTVEAIKRGFWVSHRSHISIFGNRIGT